MNWQKHDYDNIPGTYVFDGKRSNSAYGLNKMAYSFNNEANRQEFAADREAYCRKFNLTEEQITAVMNNDFLGLLRLGGNIYYLAKIAVFFGLTVQDAGAAFHGTTTEEFKQYLLNNSQGFENKLKEQGGFWGG